MSVTTPTPRSGRGWRKIVVVLLLVRRGTRRPARTWRFRRRPPGSRRPAQAGIQIPQRGVLVACLGRAVTGLLALAAWRVWEAPGRAQRKSARPSAISRFDRRSAALCRRRASACSRPVSGLVVLALLAAAGSTARRLLPDRWPCRVDPDPLWGLGGVRDRVLERRRSWGLDPVRDQAGDVRIDLPWCLDRDRRGRGGSLLWGFGS